MSIGEEAHFENSWKGTLKVLRELSVFYFLLIACLIYVLVKEDYEMLKIGAWLLVPVFVVPHLILHIWYYFVDRSVSIDIYYWQNHLIYRKERKEEKICFDEIDHIVKYVSWHGRGVYGQVPHNF